MSDSFERKPGSVFSDYGYAGSRKEALAQGTIIDVGNTRWEAGFKWPLAIAADVYDDCVKWDEADNDKVETPVTQDLRLWNLVHAAAECVRLEERHTNRLTFDIYCVNRNDESFKERRVTVLIIGHPDDGGHPCLTIRYPIPEVN
ncbi:MAG: hypothetical protein OXC80_00815 [Gammaproteobacteria bacterium]|nr:hypothetical protein [Gammaproteobacteria bacterium]